MAIRSWFQPITDAEVPECYQATLAKYRRLVGYWDGPQPATICWRVHAGFTVFSCHGSHGRDEAIDYMQRWDNFRDTPTSNALVFWIPSFVPFCRGTADEQRKELASTGGLFQLPVHHLADFGEVNLLAGLMLAHREVTGQSVLSLCGEWVRTDRSHEHGHLCLYRGVNGLRYEWGPVSGSARVFALGVEPIE